MRTTSWCLVSILGLVVVTACGGKATLDPADVQAKVAAEAASRVGVAVATTSCPGGVKAAQNASFTCTVTFQGGGALAFRVDQRDAAGTLAVSPVGDWLRGDVMEADLVTEMFLIGHHGATVECGDAVVPLTLPGSARCTVKKGAGTATVEVAVDAQREVAWKLVGTL